MTFSQRLSTMKIPGIPQIIPVLAVLMEVFWVYAWEVWLSGIPALGWAGTPLNLFSCILLAIFCEIVSYLFLSKKWSLRRVRSVVLTSSLILLIALVRLNLGGGYSIWDWHWTNYAATHLSAIITGFIFGIYFIWRGISIGGRSNTFSNLYPSFLVGLTGIIVLFVIWALSSAQKENIWSNAGIYAVTFFGVGLFSLALANLEKFRAELLQHKESGISFSRQWFSILVILVLVILGVSLAVAGIFSADILGTWLHFFSNLGGWLLTGLIYALYPVALVASLLYYVIRFLMNLLNHAPPPPPPQMTQPPDWQKFAQNQGPNSLPPALVLALKWGLIALVIVLVVFFLARALVRYSQRKMDSEVEEIHETIWSWNIFNSDLQAILVWLFGWARRRRNTKVGAPSAMFADFKNSESSDRNYSVRELYRAWLWQERQNGSPRRQSETPYEYRQRIGPAREPVADEIEAITESYITERYGEVSAQPDKLRQLNRLWRVLRDKINDLNRKE